MKEEIQIMSCTTNYTHDDKIKEALNEMPSEDNLMFVTELFKVLGDETRTKILSVLVKGELCVCDISEALNMTKSAISHQLKVLRMARLVKPRKVGKEVYYSFYDHHILKIYELAIEHVKE